MTTPQGMLELAEYHERECNRHVNGQCQTRRCLLRGGMKIRTDTVDYSIATCEEHETATALRDFARQAAAPQGREVTDEMVTAAMRAFERMSSILRYREKDKWHSCDIMGMRDAIRAAIALIPAVAPEGAGSPHPFQQCEKCWQPATCKKYGCREAALAQAQQPGEDNPLACRCFSMSEPYLSGWRLIVGFNAREEVNAAQEYVARLPK